LGRCIEDRMQTFWKRTNREHKATGKLHNSSRAGV
jgi:hypothetical protein